MPGKGRKKKRQKRAMRPRKCRREDIREDMFTPEGVLITAPLEIGMKGNQENSCAGCSQEDITANDIKGEK